MARAFVPSAFITQMSELPFWDDTYAICRPSGENWNCSIFAFVCASRSMRSAPVAVVETAPGTRVHAPATAHAITNRDRRRIDDCRVINSDRTRSWPCAAQ